MRVVEIIGGLQTELSIEEKQLLDKFNKRCEKVKQIHIEKVTEHNRQILMNLVNKNVIDYDGTYFKPWSENYERT